MKKIRKIILLIILFIFAGSTSIVHGRIPQADSLNIKQLQEKLSVNLQDKNSKSKLSRQKTYNQKRNGTVIKQVKGARPDMSKVRGARPPYIERPSGSRFPKGVGKPGGAFRPGKH